MLVEGPKSASTNCPSTLLHSNLQPLMPCNSSDAFRLVTLQKAAGAGVGVPTSKMDELLEGDFDPDAWDRQMAEAFDDDYYDVRGALLRGWHKRRV